MSWQSEHMEEALEEKDPVTRLISVVELLHPLPLSDPIHGFIDIPLLIRDAHTAHISKGESKQ